MTTNVTVEKRDIYKMGHTLYNDEGHVSIICNGDLSQISEILLRSILKCFGEDFKIVSVEDSYHPNNTDLPTEIKFITNLPYEQIPDIC